MNKTLKIILAVLLVLVIGIGAVTEVIFLLPEQFDDLYLAELSDKYRRLRLAEDEPKVIIIGGSSVAFGIDSQLMSDYLGMDVVNFGLYGPLGTTIMMDLTRGYIREGDIIVLAPETDKQTMSMYFNGEGMWECCDSDFTMLFKIRSRNWGEMLGSFWQYAEKKLRFYRYGKPQTHDVYNHDSFNERGDIEFEREAPNMDNWVDEEVPIDLSTDIIEPEFIDYINEYTAYAEKQGATVVFSYPPMNRLAVQQDEQGQLEYATYLRNALDCQIISNLDDYIMEPGYFYDTNYHVNSRGVTVHTARLLQDLYNFLREGEIVDIRLPEPYRAGQDASGEPTGEPAADDASAEAAEEEIAAEQETEIAVTPVPEEEQTGSSRDEALFTYEAYDEGWAVTGVTAEGKNAAELEVPWEHEGKKVLAIEENTFAGCDRLTDIYIQANVQRIVKHAFDGCPVLQSIHVDNVASAVLVPGSDLFENVSERVKVYVSQDDYGSFVADYFWGNYIERVKIEGK